MTLHCSAGASCHWPATLGSLLHAAARAYADETGRFRPGRPRVELKAPPLAHAGGITRGEYRMRDDLTKGE